MAWTRYINKINYWMSFVSSCTLIVMASIISYEVISRYFFNSPTIWAWGVNRQLLLLLIMFGMSDVYRQGAHIRVDVLTSHLSPRGIAFLEVVFSPVYFLIAITLAWYGLDYFLKSLFRLETASTLFAPPIYPIKATIPLCGILLTLQGFAKLAADLAIVFGYSAGSEKGK